MYVSSKVLGLVIPGCVQERRKFPCGNSLFWVQTLKSIFGIETVLVDTFTVFLKHGLT